MLQDVTRELHGDPRGFQTGLQMVSGGFKEVSEGFRGFQGVPVDRKNVSRGEPRGIMGRFRESQGSKGTLRKVSSVSREVPEGLRGFQSVPKDPRGISKMFQEISRAFQENTRKGAAARFRGFQGTSRESRKRFEEFHKRFRVFQVVSSDLRGDSRTL